MKFSSVTYAKPYFGNSARSLLRDSDRKSYVATNSDIVSDLIELPSRSFKLLQPFLTKYLGNYSIGYIIY